MVVGKIMELFRSREVTVFPRRSLITRFPDGEVWTLPSFLRPTSKLMGPKVDHGVTAKSLILRSSLMSPGAIRKVRIPTLAKLMVEEGEMTPSGMRGSKKMVA